MIDRTREREIIILLVEHDMKIVMEVSDNVVVLNQGKVIAEVPLETVQRGGDPCLPRS
jgi:branched-chain amino acid transport system ATP-binding protein